MIGCLKDLTFIQHKENFKIYFFQIASQKCVCGLPLFGQIVVHMELDEHEWNGDLSLTW